MGGEMALQESIIGVAHQKKWSASQNTCSSHGKRKQKYQTRHSRHWTPVHDSSSASSSVHIDAPSWQKEAKISKQSMRVLLLSREVKSKLIRILLIQVKHPYCIKIAFASQPTVIYSQIWRKETSHKNIGCIWHLLQKKSFFETSFGQLIMLPTFVVHWRPKNVPQTVYCVIFLFMNKQTMKNKFCNFLL